jgi:hypothetical protein
MTRRADILPSLPPRGLCREVAAAYVGVGVTLFDRMVADGRMPQPKVANGRNVWDRLALDVAFEGLPERQADGSTKEPVDAYEGWRP